MVDQAISSRRKGELERMRHLLHNLGNPLNALRRLSSSLSRSTVCFLLTYFQRSGHDRIAWNGTLLDELCDACLTQNVS